MNINRERLAETFTILCETDSPSRHEGKVAELLKNMFEELGADGVTEDESAAVTGSECGNLVVRFEGDLPLEPIFLSCHMDTVEPARGVKVLRTGDLFTSAGETVLGSDDKSGIAACIECMQVLKENNIPHRPLEFVITTCEEIGLLGAKAFDPDLLTSREGYALDSTGFAKVITHAPSANKLHITVRGVAAHAGLHPEWGVNAITVAARALAEVPCGRIDDETTANFGTIGGGVASNIVPEEVSIKGEVRSHDPDKLERITQQIRQVFTEAVESWQDPGGNAKGRPELEFHVENDFPAMRLERDSQVIRRIDEAARLINLELEYQKAGGGSDANIYNGHGLQTAIVATGMTNVHSTDEQVDLGDMANLSKLLLVLATQTSC